MPAEADPARYIAAGPWCFAGRENLFPNFEKRFDFCPEPLANAALLPVAARAAETLCVKSIPLVAEKLDPRFREFSPVYWQTLLAPWAISVASQIVERAVRCRAIIKAFGKTALIIPVYPADAEFNFADENDFYIRGALGDAFNFWLFSRLLEKDWPPLWEKSVSPILPALAREKSTPLRRAKDFIRSLSLRLLFPRLKGVSLIQALKYSFALRRCEPSPDKSVDLDKLYARSEFLEGLDLDEIVLSIFLKALPASIKNLARPGRPAPISSRPRVASILASENSEYRQKLALWREAGGKLAWVQHGGNYGMIKVSCDRNIVEYSQDAFFTWGWRAEGDRRFIPMPYPGLAKIADSWQPDQANNILFVGAEMAAYGYRLESRPTPTQFLAYRRYKKLFLTALGERRREKLYYRPYFNLPGTFSDFEWLEKRFPGLKRCSGPLFPQLRRCGVLILDHHGTTMLEALAAGIPTICYWNPAHWPLSREGEASLRIMENAGVWHPTPEAAAFKVNSIIDDVGSWMGETREARAELRRRLARLPEGDIDKIWTTALKNL